MNTTSTDLAAALRAGSEHLGTHRRAATDLLIDHEFWLLRTDFVRDCVSSGDDGTAVVSFGAASEAVDQGRYRGSTSELAILAFAVALGTDRYGLTHFGRWHRRAVASAVLSALDLQPSDLGSPTKETED